jgi:hypothetical protein
MLINNKTFLASLLCLTCVPFTIMAQSRHHNISAKSSTTTSKVVKAQLTSENLGNPSGGVSPYRPRQA